MSCYNKSVLTTFKLSTFPARPTADTTNVKGSPAVMLRNLGANNVNGQPTA